MKDDKYQLKARSVLMRKSGVSIRKICKELRIPYSSLYLWVAIYDTLGEEGLRKSYVPQKSPTEKLQIVEDVLNNKLSLNAASVKYLICSATIAAWVKAYRRFGACGLHRKNGAQHTMARKKRDYSPEELNELTELRRRNEWLEAENAMLKKAKALVEAKRAQQRANGQESSKN